MRLFAKVVLVFLVLAACTQPAGATDEIICIESPTVNQSLFGEKSLSIEWTSALDEWTTYSITYSTNGKDFPYVIAQNLPCSGYIWSPPKKIRNKYYGWVKIKAFSPLGKLLAMAQTPVSFLPETGIVVSKSEQKLFLLKNGEVKAQYVCSTALPRYDGTQGSYKVYSKERNHWSRTYEVWMPHSLFYHRGYAIHATKIISKLGRPASHGCVRLHPRDAKDLYSRVGKGVCVTVLPYGVSVQTLADPPRCSVVYVCDEYKGPVMSAKM